MNDIDPTNDAIQPVSDGAIEEPSSMPLGVNDFTQEADPLIMEEGSGKSINTGALLIVGVVVVAGGLLFSMRTIATASGVMGATEMDEIVGSFLERLDKKNNDDIDNMVAQRDVIDVIGDDYTTIQVPLSNVQCNPFVVDGEDDGTPAPTPPDDPDDGLTEAERLFFEQKKIREGQVTAAKARLELTTVMLGEPRLANINDSIVREGEDVTIDDVDFTVESISLDLVTLRVHESRWDINETVTLFVRRD